MAVMDFDHERQVFRLSDLEMHVLHIHPAWGVCPRDRAPFLYTYILRQASVTLDISQSTLAEMHRNRAVRDTAQVILGQLEPFIEEDARSFAEQAACPQDLPEDLE